MVGSWPGDLMGIWQVTALGDGALEPYGQIAGPCLARLTSLAIQVPDTSTKMDGIWLVRLVPGTRSAHQGMTPRVRSGSRQRPAVHVTESLETRWGRNPRQPLHVPVRVVVV